ncbi:MAG: hypothetical protein AAFQ90_13010, partial [Pseudomonadota bacterium]
MKRVGLLLVVLIAATFGFGAVIASGALGKATIEEEVSFQIPSGSSLSSVAAKLEDEGLISSADGFLLRARLFGSAKPIQAGTFYHMKTVQDLAIYSQLQSMTGKHIAEIGGGHSRVLGTLAET